MTEVKIISFSLDPKKLESVEKEIASLLDDGYTIQASGGQGISTGGIQKIGTYQANCFLVLIKT